VQSDEDSTEAVINRMEMASRTPALTQATRHDNMPQNSQAGRPAQLLENSGTSGSESETSGSQKTAQTLILQGLPGSGDPQGYPETPSKEPLRTLSDDHMGNLKRMNSESVLHCGELIDRIKALEEENAILKSWIDPDMIHQGRPFCQVVHRFKSEDKIFSRPPV
jgi:hypothetical protein